MPFRSVPTLLALGALVAGLVLFHACTDGSGGGKLRTSDGKGRPTATLQSYDSLQVSLEGAEPRTHYDFVVAPAETSGPVLGQAKLVTDRRGDIPPSLLVIDIDPRHVPVGSYAVTVTGPEVDETVIVDVQDPTEPYIYTCDPLGEIANSYPIGDPVYARGGNFPPHAEVHLGVVEDRRSYEDGLPLDGMFGSGGIGGGYITVLTDADGNIPITQVPAHNAFMIEPGDGFDLVADLAPHELFHAATDAVDGHAVVGLTYQTDDVGTDVDADLACTIQGVYKDTFTTDEDVYAWINPPLQYQLPSGRLLVAKYVVHHKDHWKNGDALTDISGGNETDGVQHGCTNEGIILVFPGPTPPGKYDIIIDIDLDGKYTQGLDIVDGGSAESQGVVGFTVE